MRQSSRPLAAAAPEHTPALIAGQYDVLTELGKGGMGGVYRVRDRRNGQELALKLLHARSADSDHAEFTRLFEREFHSLAQLAHPCIIAVLDYGVDDGRPYYTMELLSGVSLRQKGRLPWPEACRLLRDVASALALLHSRRLLHRDVTPRNVHCLPDGRAKLIDFGLMAQAGVQRAVMGTPPFVAPEAVHLQPLDGRSDLYALGATAYWALTGRHAFSARKLVELRDSFRTTPVAPSLLNAEIPEALSRLVLSLLSIDPDGRPSSAAEVIEQLNGIAGLESDESLATTAAYLTTPKLIGRRGPLLQVRRQLVRALRGHGSALMVDGEAGVGRSRFLDACVLDAKLLGFLALRADAAGGADEYGVAQSLCQQLLELRPQEAVGAAGTAFELLAAALPALAQAYARHVATTAQSPFTQTVPPQPPSDPAGAAQPSARPNSASSQPARERLPQHAATVRAEERSIVQEALRQWFLAFTRSRPLMIAVDDVNQIDEPSAAMLAALSEVGFGCKLMLVVSTASDRTPRAPAPQQLLASSGQRIRLRPLDAPESRELLSSVFGRVPNVDLLAERLHTAAAGNPRALVELADHLVSHGTVRYDAGCWSLPPRIDAGKLPDTLEQARATRVSELPADARALAEIFSLSPDHVFSLEEAESLCGGSAPGRLHQALGSLVSAGIVSLQDKGCGFSHRAYVDVLAAGIGLERIAPAHHKLASVLEQRAAPPHEVAWHRQAAGEDDLAIDTLCAWLEPYMRDPNRSPHVGSELKRVLAQLERALVSSERLGRPARERFVLRSALVAFGSYEPVVFHRHAPRLLSELSEQSGLSAYHALDASVPAPERLTRALQSAQASYDATEAHARVLAPIDAIRQLTRWVAALLRVVGGTYDRKLMSWMPSLEPFGPLSPQLQVVAESYAAVVDLADGNFLRARERWRVRMLANPSVMSVRYALGMIEAMIGMHSALEHADRCEADPGFRIQAWRIRMSYYLVQGDWVQAEACRKTEERLRIQHGNVQELEGSHLQGFLIAYARADDLMGVKQTMEGLSAMAKRFEGWVPIFDRARAEYHRLRGDYVQALLEYDSALSRMEPARHAAWYTTVEGQLGTLLAIDRAHEARAIALKSIEICEQRESVLAKLAISRALALIEARLCDFPRAVSRIEAVIAAYQQIGVSGMLLAAAHETRARIALEMDDRVAFESHAARCAEVYDRGRSTALKAKYARLLDDARRKGVEQGALGDDSRATARTTHTRSETAAYTLHTALASCRGSDERCAELLKTILKQMHLDEGWLYTFADDGLKLSAARGSMPAGLEHVVQRFVAEHVASSEAVTQAAVAGARFERESVLGFLERDGRAYRPLLLSSQREDHNWISGVAVVCQPLGANVLVPHDMLRAISDALLDAGDVAGRTL